MFDLFPSHRTQAQAAALRAAQAPYANDITLTGNRLGYLAPSQSVPDRTLATIQQTAHYTELLSSPTPLADRLRRALERQS